MKKIGLLMLLCIAAVSANAQLKVNADGKIMLGSTTLNPVSPLAFGGVGNTYAKTYFEGNGYVMQLKPLGKSSNMSSSLFGCGLRVAAPPVQNSGLAGVYSNISGYYNSANGFTVGVEGIAGDGKNGYNYGVTGSIVGAKNGAGIFGCVGYEGHSRYIHDKYAGYFLGKVFVEGDLFIDQDHLFHYSNEDVMPNKQPIGSVLNRVMSITPFAYKFPSSSDSIYALSAQNISNVFPYLVSSDGEFVDYTELIPILVKAIKEMQAEIDVLQSALARSGGNLDFNSSYRSPLYSGTSAVLYQNSPNPFTNSTTIRFTLPDDVQDAYIYIFDMTGKMQKQIPIDISMQSVTIQGYELSAGMYIYSLVIGGKEVDSKRMILSK
ncbi:MAG: T9SS type A sorting domain-containing protein [Bacteroidaceae bacterium]|nr:T9SS type A sorting domain-containing protein [Bacteroidaceae bacterium]